MKDVGLTDDEVKIIDNLVSKCDQRCDALKAHAVEVLAERLHHITQLERIHSNYAYWKDIRESTRNEYRSEARALLGWDE